MTREERREYMKAYYKEHREKKLAYQHAYNKEHREEIKAYSKAYQQDKRLEVGTYNWMHNKSKRYIYHNKRKNQYAVCEVCGRPAEQIHHIVTWKQFLDKNGFTVSDLNEFGDDIIREYNDPSNLMAVCKECHQDIHMTVKIPVDYCKRGEEL